MKAKMESNQASLAVIGIDIGKEIFHIVGLGVDGKIAFRRKIWLPIWGKTGSEQGVLNTRVFMSTRPDRCAPSANVFANSAPKDVARFGV